MNFKKLHPFPSSELRTTVETEVVAVVARAESVVVAAATESLVAAAAPQLSSGPPCVRQGVGQRYLVPLCVDGG